MLALVSLGCGSDDSPSEPTAGTDAALVASKLATVAVAVALGPQGRSFLDNFVSCPRRGVISYYNTSAGRSATFHGCDPGDGVVIDGVAEVRWIGPGLSGDRRLKERLQLVGPLTVRLRGRAVEVGTLALDGIGFGAAELPSVYDLARDALRATLDGEEQTLTGAADPVHIFNPTGLELNTLPNPAGRLAALGEPDLKRVAYHLASELADVLINELLEVQRGEHAHSFACGTLHVKPDPVALTTHLTYDVQDCPVEGTVLDGRFEQDVTVLDMAAGRFGMVVYGDVRIGGGVPRTSFTRLEWDISGLNGDPWHARIAGVLLNGAERRDFSFDVVLDD